MQNIPWENEPPEFGNEENSIAAKLKKLWSSISLYLSHKSPVTSFLSEPKHHVTLINQSRWSLAIILKKGAKYYAGPTTGPIAGPTAGQTAGPRRAASWLSPNGKMLATRLWGRECRKPSLLFAEGRCPVNKGIFLCGQGAVYSYRPMR